MSEPRRWKDSPDAPVGMRELLGSAPRSRALDDATFRRGARRVATISVAPAAVVFASFWTKLAAAGVIGLATAGTIAAVTVREPPPAPPPAPKVVSAAPIVATPAPTEATPVPVPEEAPPAPAAVAPIQHTRVVAAVPRVKAPEPVASASAAVWVPEPPARPKSTLADELGLLQRARDHLARSPETALGELAQHRSLYPAGALADERDLMELDALRRTGRVQDARSRAQAWLARDPRGIHADRVRRILSTLE